MTPTQNNCIAQKKTSYFLYPQFISLPLFQARRKFMANDSQKKPTDNDITQLYVPLQQWVNWLCVFFSFQKRSTVILCLVWPNNFPLKWKCLLCEWIHNDFICRLFIKIRFRELEIEKINEKPPTSDSIFPQNNRNKICRRRRRRHIKCYCKTISTINDNCCCWSCHIDELRFTEASKRIIHNGWCSVHLEWLDAFTKYCAQIHTKKPVELDWIV